MTELGKDLAYRSKACGDYAHQHNKRYIIGIAGTPGAGKTTLATSIVSEVNESAGESIAAYVPFDGFRLSKSMLEKSGAGNQNALSTFDTEGYIYAMRRIKEDTEHDIYLPSFSNDIAEPISASIVVPSSCRIIFTEGSYLLIDSAIYSCFDECVFLDENDAVIKDRLIARRLQNGETLPQARKHFDEVDKKHISIARNTAHLADELL